MSDLIESIASRMNEKALERLKAIRASGQFTFRTIDYDPNTSDNIKRDLEKAFKTRVQPAFLKEIARTHFEELQQAGVCNHGIDCMHIGILPHSKDGKPYPVNIDHIEELAGAGTSFENINNFDNLVLIYRPYHDIKTSFTSAQTKTLSELSEITILAPTNDRKIVIPQGTLLETEILGRPIWLYRAKAASERIFLLKEQGIEGQELSEAHKAMNMMWKWAENAHKDKDPESFTALMENFAAERPNNCNSKSFKQTKKFLEAKQENYSAFKDPAPEPHNPNI